MQNIISLTTIPPRMKEIGPTLTSLLEQSADIDEIQLWIPNTYRRHGFGSFQVPSFPEGIRVMRATQDLGPATKVLPSVEYFRGQDVRIIYCDDDRVYSRDWAANMIAASEQHPDECIVDIGEPIAAIELRAERDSLRYRFLNMISLTVYAHFYRRRLRAMFPNEGYVDIAKGYGGVLVSPEFFLPSAIDIPEFFWPVDDIWLSGHLAMRGVRVRKIGPATLSEPHKLRKIAALEKFEFKGLRRNAANMACIDYYRKHHNVWTS